MQPNKQRETLIQQNIIIIYNKTINTHCNWSTLTNTWFLYNPCIALGSLLTHSHCTCIPYCTSQKTGRRTPAVYTQECKSENMIQLFGQSQMKGKRPPCRNREPRGVLTEEQQRWKEVEGDCGAPTAVSLPEESVCLYFT